MIPGSRRIPGFALVVVSTACASGPAIDPALLPDDLQQEFSELPRGVATLPSDVLAAHRLPELQSPWLIAIEQGWEENVLQK